MEKSIKKAEERLAAELIRFLEREVWSAIPPELLGRKVTREEEDEVLGFGPDGV